MEKLKAAKAELASNAACMNVIGSYGAAKSAIIKWTHSLGVRYGRDECANW